MRAQGLTAILFLLAGLVVIARPEPAVGQASPQTFESDPVIAGGVDGPVWISELIGDELWIGGDFSSVRNHEFGSTELATDNVAVININTGNYVDKSFDVNGPVYGIEYHDGTVWLVGNFDQVDGETHNNIVALDVHTGRVESSFSASANDQLRDVQYHDGWLYFAGNLTWYNGQRVSKVVRVNPETGDRDTTWNPAISLFIESIDTYGNMLIAGERANNLATETKLISLTTGEKLDGLDPAGINRRGVWDATFAPDGQTVYSADLGNTINHHTINDLLLWVSPRAGGDMQAVAATSSRVYAGFHEAWQGNGNRRIVALYPANGREDTSWYVEMNSYWGVRDIQIYDQGLVATGEFSNVNGINARRVAIFRPEGPWSPAEPLEAPGVVGDVTCDGNSNIADALMIAQYTALLRTEQECPHDDPTLYIDTTTGDVNGNGRIDIGDALMIGQCAALVPNDHCPA